MTRITMLTHPRGQGAVWEVQLTIHDEPGARRPRKYSFRDNTPSASNKYIFERSPRGRGTVCMEFYHVRVHVYALGQWAETRADMPRHVRVHVVNICERPLGQWAESRCWRRAVHSQPCVRCNRVAFRRVMRECIQCSRTAHRVVDAAWRMISHACNAVASLVAFLTSRDAGAVVRLSHCWCRDRRVYCRIAVRHSKVQTVSAQVNGRRLTSTCSDMLV